MKLCDKIIDNHHLLHMLQTNTCRLDIKSCERDQSFYSCKTESTVINSLILSLDLFYSLNKKYNKPYLYLYAGGSWHIKSKIIYTYNIQYIDVKISVHKYTIKQITSFLSQPSNLHKGLITSKDFVLKFNNR